MRQPANESSSLIAQCEQAVEKLDRAARLQPKEIEQEIYQIQRDVVRLRDSLIDRLRQSNAGPSLDRPHRGLERVNAALSLIVGVQYPVTSIQPAALEQARDVLAQAFNQTEWSGFD